MADDPIKQFIRISAGEEDLALESSKAFAVFCGLVVLSSKETKEPSKAVSSSSLPIQSDAHL